MSTVMNEMTFPLNIQLFAEGEPATPPSDPATPPADPNTPPEPPKEPEKKYSDKELNDILTRQKAKWEQDAQEKVDEAKKLAKMNADEKAKYEQQKQLDDIAKREAEITKRELTATAKEELATRGLPLSLADVLNYESAETVQASMKAVETAFRDAVEKAVNEKLKGSGAPKNPSSGEVTDPTIAAFRTGAGLK